ncbi:MAG: response regulator [Planctomycetota bacterium]|nr:response regulator [Planctomycetota bacterium]
MKRALIVDDSRAMRMILSKYLKALGFEIHQAANGLEALKTLQEMDWADIALVDWNMPGMNGVEFVHSVRAQDKYKDLRIMMVTSETDVERMLLALEAGADEYVMKPFTQEIIQGKLSLLGLAA